MWCIGLFVQLFCCAVVLVSAVGCEKRSLAELALTALNRNAVFKILLVGDTGVGKSALLMRFTQDRSVSVHQEL